MKNKLVCTPGAEDQDEENESITNDVCGYAKQRCPICLNFLAQDVGIPENCYHAFCVACILKWSETSTSCPVDRKLFKAVYKINQSGAFTKIQVKSRRLKETHDSCYSSCNHICSLCSLCNKICIRTEADRALQNQSLECDKVQKGCIINKEKNESEPEINSLSCTSSCFTDIAASCKPTSLIPVIPYCTDINAEVSENKEMDLIIQKREEMKYLQSRSVMPGIQSTCFSMDTGTLTRPVVSSRLNEFIFHLNYFSVHNKGSSKRMCVLSAVQEGTEKKQTTSGSSNRRGTKKKPVYSSTRRRSTRNSKSEDMGESQGSPKSSNSDRDTSGCNSSSTNVSSSENWVKQTPKQRKRPTKKGSQVRRRLRSSAQTEEVSSESEANSANETEQESEEKQLSEEIQSEMDIVKSDTEATCASKVECGQSPSSPSIENMSKEQLASLSSLKQSDVDLPHYPSLQSEQNCGFGKPASPVLKNEEMFKQDLLPASPASEIHLESETGQLQDLSDTEMQTEPEQECTSTSEKQDLEGIETPGSPFSKNNHSSENESSQSFHSPMMQQEIEVEDSVLSSDSEHQEPKGQCVLDSLEENLQDSKHDVLESSISLKEQHSEDSTDVSVLENAELLSPTPSENVDNHSEGSLISFTLNRVEQSEVVCSTKDHDDTREKCILEPASSEDSSKTNISTELNVVVPMDTFILEQKSNLDKQINNLAGSVKETEQRECFEESATATCILEDSEENTSENSVNKSEEDTEFAQTDTTENVLDACENISEIIETKENSTSIESFESSLKPPAVLDECKITLPDNNENGNASIINCEQPTVLGDDDYDSVAMQCDSLSDQNDSEIDHPSEVKENFKLDLEVKQKETLNLNSEVAICTTEELNSPNTEPKQINNDKIKSDSRTRKSRFHSPSTQWSRSKSEVKERQRSRSPAKPTCKSRSRSPAKPTCKSRSRSPAKPTSKSRSRSPAKPTSKSRSRSPAKPTSKSRSRSRERDEREKGGQWKGRSRDHRTRKQSHSRSRTRSRSRSENRSKIRNRCIAPERNEKVCFSPPWKERWPPDNFKGSRGNERYKRNKQDRPREYFRNDWQDINKDKFEHNYEDKNKNDYPDWVVEQKSVKHRGRGQDRPRQSYRGSHWEDNQYNSRDSWNKNANLDWHSPRGGGFRGRGGFHGAFNHGDQNESRWNNRSSFSGYEQSRFPEPRNYKPKFEQDQFGSPAARSGWSSTSSWAVRKTLPADVQNYYSKNSKRGRTTGLQSGWPKQDEPSDPDHTLDDQASQHNEGSHIPLNVIQSQMNTPPPQMTAPPQINDPQITVPPPQLNAHQMTALPPQMNAPPLIGLPPQINAPQMTSPPPQMNAPPPQMNALPPQMNIQQMSAPLQINIPQMIAPPPQMNAPPPQMNAPPPQMNAPPPQMNAPPPHMSALHVSTALTSQRNTQQMTIPSPQRNAPPQVSALSPSRNAPPPKIAATPPQIAAPPPQKNNQPLQLNAHSQRNAPVQSMNIFPYTVSVHPPLVNVQHNPYNVHPSVRVQLQQGVPRAKVSDSTSGPQGLPPPPPPPPPSQQVSCVASQSDGKIQKVQIQERAAQEVKMAIKPYYQNKDITKEEYKEIVKKAVDKVCHSKSGEVDSSKVANLVKAYVDKYKHSRKKGPD